MEKCLFKDLGKSSMPATSCAVYEYWSRTNLVHGLILHRACDICVQCRVYDWIRKCQKIYSQWHNNQFIQIRNQTQILTYIKKSSRAYQIPIHPHCKLIEECSSLAEGGDLRDQSSLIQPTKYAVLIPAWCYMSDLGLKLNVDCGVCINQCLVNNSYVIPKQ